jgi:putative serine protease PepD
MLVAAALATALIAGCGGGDDGDSGTVASESGTTTEVVVQAADGGDFNPAQIYKDVAPGVVTITSVFEGAAEDLLGGAAAGQGSGIVVSKEGEIVTNAHVVTNGGNLNGGGSP